NYMSPEQASVGREVDGRADVYSLGCVIYEVLAGRPPFLGSSAGEVLARHSLDPVPPLPRRLRSARAPLRAPAPERLEPSVARALAKEPADRFATAGEFAEALAEALAGAPASASRPSATLGAMLRAVHAPRSRRRAALVALSLALLGAGVVGLGDLLWQRSH